MSELQPCADVIPCWGASNCATRDSCENYHAAEFADPLSLRIHHCPVDRDGQRTLYRPMFVVPVGPVAERRH